MMNRTISHRNLYNRFDDSRIDILRSSKGPVLIERVLALLDLRWFQVNLFQVSGRLEVVNNVD